MSWLRECKMVLPNLLFVNFNLYSFLLQPKSNKERTLWGSNNFQRSSEGEDQKSI